MRIRTSTTRRLFLVFVLLFVLMSSASFLTFKALSDVHDMITDVVTYNREFRTTLSLATAVRDQYAHEAHTIILGNNTHLAYHDAACRRVEALVTKLNDELRDSAISPRVASVGSAARKQADWFQDKLLPAVLEHDTETVLAGHDRLLRMVAGIQRDLDAIATHLASRVLEAEKDAGRIARSAMLWLLISHGLALAFAAGSAVYLGRSVARPLAVLGEGARQLADGNLDTVIELDTGDEFAILANQFNTMTRAIKQHQVRKIQQEKLAAVGRLAAGVAHEINNPLGVILGYVRLMKEQADQQTCEDLAVIEEEAVHAQEIVEGLLNLARPIDPTDGSMDLEPLCNEVAERVQGMFGDSHADIRVEGEGSARGNEQAIRQVLTNIVKNAVEAAGPAGSVAVRIGHSASGTVSVEVEDSGPGLSPDVLDHLGEPFFTTKPRGTGLGLAVSRAILESHGGRLEATNRQGGGAKFVIILPVMEPRPASDRDRKTPTIGLVG